MSYRDGVHEYSLRSIFRFFSTFFTHWNLVSMSHWQHYAKQTLNQEFFGRTISKFIIIRELKNCFKTRYLRNTGPVKFVLDVITGLSGANCTEFV